MLLNKNQTDMKESMKDALGEWLIAQFYIFKKFLMFIFCILDSNIKHSTFIWM